MFIHPQIGADIMDGGFLDDMGLSRVWEKITDLNDWMPKNAGAHNSIYRGKNITYKLDDGSLYSDIHDGSFNDIFVGDYIRVNVKKVTGSANTSTYTVQATAASSATAVILRIVDIDRDYNKGGSSNAYQNRHHVVMMPDTDLGTSIYGVNSSSPLSGGYMLSEMHTTVMPALATQLESIFGDHLLTQYVYLINETYASDSGLASTMGGKNATWTTCKVCLLSEFEVFGHPALTSLGTNKYRYEVGKDYGQLQAFRLNPSLISNSSAWWLKSYVWMNSTGYVFISTVDQYGCASTDSHPNSHYLRPKILIG